MPNETVRAQRLLDNVAVLFSAGANVGVSYGPDGTYLLDSSFPQCALDIVEAALALGAPPIRALITTHWHHDHAGGNEQLARSGALIIAHENTRRRMSTEQYLKPLQLKIPPAPEIAWPTVTFNDSLSLHVNGDTLRIVHVPGAHTDGDVLVKWEKANVILANDFFVPDEDLPFVDFGAGGNFDGFIRGVEVAIALCDEATQVIPGHGEMSRKADLVRFRDLLVAMRDPIAREVERGSTLDRVIALALVDRYYRGGLFTPAAFVEMVYESLLQSSEAQRR